MKAFIQTLWLVSFVLLLTSANPPKLKTMKLTEGVTAGLPKDFVAMSDNDIAQKYPSTKKPLAMFTSLDRTVDFGLNVSKSNWAGKNPAVLQKIYKATIIDLYGNVNFIYEGIENINGRDFILFEFNSTTDGTSKYTYLGYTIIGDEKKGTRVYIFNFSCGKEKQQAYQEIAKAVIHSIKINAQKLVETVEEFQPVHKGKKPIEVLKHQKSQPKKK